MVRQAHHPERSRRTNSNYQNTKFKIVKARRKISHGSILRDRIATKDEFHRLRRVIFCHGGTKFKDRRQKSGVRIRFDGLEDFGFGRGESLILCGVKSGSRTVEFLGLMGIKVRSYAGECSTYVDSS